MEPGKELEHAAVEYIRNHKIQELLTNMNAQLVYNRPEDPRAFLINHISQLQALKAKNESKGEGTKDSITTTTTAAAAAASASASVEAPTLLTDANYEALFRIFDPAGRGWLTVEQYATALKTAGVIDINMEPKGFVEDRITRDTFVSECRQGVIAATATFVSAEEDL